MTNHSSATLIFWFYSEHLSAWMDLMSSLVGYDFDESDEYAIRAGIREKDPMEDDWFEYPLIGENIRLEMHLASVPGSHVVDCRVEGADSIVEQIRCASDVMEVLQSRFYLLPTKFYREDVCKESGREELVYRRKGR